MLALAYGMRRGEVLGLHATVSGRPYELTGETLQPCQLDFLRRDDFLRFLQNHADACLNAAQHLSRNCQSAYEMIRSLGLSHSVGEKLARLLLEWASEGDHTKEGIRIKVSLTHEEIAGILGSSVGAVKANFFHALGNLKKLLADEDAPER